MCGICGVINKKETIDKIMFEKMVDIIAYRGPDDRGVYYDNEIALGHRRLAVVDLSKEGHQPFFYKKRYVIVYNGEIYNYIQLKKELMGKGYVFSTRTDTEVLAAMYDCYGDKCVHKLNGMWAFAIYDTKKKNVFCSRDRFGIKPFYYYYKEDKFIFASEIKQILLALDHEKPVYANNQKLLEFLVFGDLDYSEETLFADIMQLRGGYNLYFDIESGKCDIVQYYDIEETKCSKKSYDVACNEFKKLFENSVAYRLHADVPVGYCLSGGLDSSSIVCMADYIIQKENVEIEQHAISSCFDNKEYDEQEYIDEVIKNTKVISHKIFPKEKDLFVELDKIIWHMDEPFGSTSIFAQWNVFKSAKEQGLTVMLDGQGADEQLAGYTSFYSVILSYYLRKFRFIKFGKEIHYYCKERVITEKHVSAMDVIANAFVSAFLPNKLKNYLKLKVGYGYSKLPFSRDIIAKASRKRSIYQVNNPQKYSVDSMKCGMAALLHYEDRNSMAHSIESRVPFLDYKLSESLYSMPIFYKIRKGITKSVLRDGLRDILPEKIRNRIGKLGFVTPEAEWINNNFDFFQAELKEACHLLSGIIDEKQVVDWFGTQKGKIGKGDFLPWRIICAGHWMKIFNVTLQQDNCE